jgi:hypothetical protein
LGAHARGTLINYGRAGEFASSAEDGIQVKYGAVSGFIAHSVTGGVQLNYGSSFAITHFGKGGVQANHGKTGKFVTDTSGGVHINHGTVRTFGEWTRDSVQYDCRTRRFFGSCRWYAPPRAVEPLRKLITRLGVTRELAHYKNDPDGALAAIKAHDWKALETDAHALAKQIQEARNDEI